MQLNWQMIFDLIFETMLNLYFASDRATIRKIWNLNYACSLTWQPGYEFKLDFAC